MFQVRTFLPLLVIFLLMASSSLFSADQSSSLPSPLTKPSEPEQFAPIGGSSVQLAPPGLSPVTPSVSAMADLAFQADRVVIKKSQRLLHLMKGDCILRTYRIALGRNPKGHKVQQGDYKTPEGEYTIDWRNPNSRFYLSMHISYPNDRDIETARKLGVPPGGAIMIHGLPNGLGWIREMHRIADWTRGCIAVTNEEIEEIWKYVPDGTPVRIEG